MARYNEHVLEKMSSEHSTTVNSDDNLATTAEETVGAGEMPEEIEAALLEMAKDDSSNESSSDMEKKHKKTASDAPSLDGLSLSNELLETKVTLEHDSSSDTATTLEKLNLVRVEGILSIKTELGPNGKKVGAFAKFEKFYVVLKGPILYTYKDYKHVGDAKKVVSMISTVSAITGIAHGVSKSKSKFIFRLKTFNGAEYLLQTSKQEEMLAWVTQIAEANDNMANPDLIIRCVAASERRVPKRGTTLDIFEGALSRSRGSRDLVIDDDDGDGGSSNCAGDDEESSSKKKDKAAERRRKEEEKVAQRIRKEKKKEAGKRRKEDEKRKKKEDAEAAKEEKKKKKAVKKKKSSCSNRVVFGVPIADTLDGDDRLVPWIVKKCIDEVERREGLVVQGLYRLSGNSTDIQALKAEFDRDDINVDLTDEARWDLHTITGCLKLYFRELPGSMVTESLFPAFVAAAKLEDRNQQLSILRGLVHKLPEEHFSTLRYLCKHLSRVAEFGATNKMDSRNIAIVFGPTLIIRSGDEHSPLAMFGDMPSQCTIVDEWVGCCDWFFDSFREDSLKSDGSIGGGTCDGDSISSAASNSDDDESVADTIESRKVDDDDTEVTL